MAVEARHLNNIFSPQFINNRVMMMNAVDVNGNAAGAGNGGLVGYGSFPMSGTTTTAETLIPMYNNNNNSVIVDSTLKTVTTTPSPMKDDSGLTYNFPVAGSNSRKRSRNVAGLNPLITGYSKDFRHCNNNNISNTGSLSFLGEDISSQLVLQQLDTDRLISQHMERVRIEIEESRKRHSRKLIEAVEIGIMKRLRAKEEEIQKFGKVNYALEERVKSLYIENQIWRDLAQNNEAAANALRSNLDIVLSQLKDNNNNFGFDNNAAAANLLNNDAESCCGSTDDCATNNNENKLNREARENHQVWRTIAAVDKKVVAVQDKKSGRGEINNKWMCRKCGKEESCILLLPCRHLCLCTTCGSSVHTCPICKSNQTASVHVNISS